MKYERFEDLPVWKAAIELAKRIYDLTRNRFFSQPGDLRDQIRRASLSVSNNIAEGFERGSTSELLYFLYVARGSCGETRSMLRFVQTFRYTTPVNSEISNLIALAETCSRQIRAWADSLQNSDIKGQRHLNEVSRQLYEGQKRRDAFEQKLQETLRRTRPQDYSELNESP